MLILNKQETMSLKKKGGLFNRLLQSKCGEKIF